MERIEMKCTKCGKVKKTNKHETKYRLARICKRCYNK